MQESNPTALHLSLPSPHCHEVVRISLFILLGIGLDVVSFPVNISQTLQRGLIGAHSIPHVLMVYLLCYVTIHLFFIVFRYTK